MGNFKKWAGGGAGVPSNGGGIDAPLRTMLMVSS